MSEVLEEKPRMTLDKSILSYVKLRDRKKELEARHTEELQPINTMLERLEAHMLEALNEAGLQSAKSPHGTAYKSTRTYAKVIDFAQVLAFIREHDAWDLLEHRVSKKAAETIIEETQEPIPGVETSSEVVINVRRAAPAC